MAPKARPVVKRLLVPKPPDTLPPAAAGWNVYLEKEADPKTEVTPARKYWRSFQERRLAEYQKEEAARLQAEEKEAARLKAAAEEDEAARLRKVPQTPPRKKRLKLQPKAAPAKRFCAEEEEEAAPTVFQTLAAEQKSAAFKEVEDEAERFADVMTADEAAAEAAYAELVAADAAEAERLIDEYLAEQ